MVFLLFSRLWEVMGESQAMWGRRLTSRPLHWWHEQMWDLQCAERPCFLIVPSFASGRLIWAEWNTFNWGYAKAVQSWTGKRGQRSVSLQTTLHRGFVLNCGAQPNVPYMPLHTLRWLCGINTLLCFQSFLQLISHSRSVSLLGWIMLWCSYFKILHETLKGTNLTIYLTVYVILKSKRKQLTVQ